MTLRRLSSARGSRPSRFPHRDLVIEILLRPPRSETRVRCRRGTGRPSREIPFRFRKWSGTLRCLLGLFTQGCRTVSPLWAGGGDRSSGQPAVELQPHAASMPGVYLPLSGRLGSGQGRSASHNLTVASSTDGHQRNSRKAFSGPASLQLSILPVQWTVTSVRSHSCSHRKQPMSVC